MMKAYICGTAFPTDDKLRHLTAPVQMQRYRISRSDAERLLQQKYSGLHIERCADRCFY